MSRGKTTVRATVSLVLLFGFYVYALAVAGGLLWLGLLAYRSFGGLLSLKIILFTGGAALAVFAGLIAALRRPSGEPPGIVVTRPEARALWDFVDDTARRVGTRTADELRLIPKVNAAVMEEARLLGLKGGGRRTLLLGIPLLAGLSAAELRSILAHEFGHYAHVHTRLGAISHRGRMAITQVLARLRRRARVTAWLFAPYVMIYLAVQSAVSRGQEREADRVSARIAGREAATGSFAAMHLLDLAWARFMAEEVECGLPFGLVPKGVHSGFCAYLDDLDDELRAAAEEKPYPAPDPFGTHPSAPERIRLLDAYGGRPEITDHGPARRLLPKGMWTSPRLDALVISRADRTALGWREFSPRVYLAWQRHLAASGFRRIARFTGENPASLASVLDHYDDPERARRWYREYIGPEFPDNALGAIVLTAAHDAGSLTFRHGWGDIRMVHADGKPFDHETYFDNFTAALRDLRPEGGRRIRELLAELSVDPAAAVGETTASNASAAVYHGLESNVSIDGRPHDMAVTDEGIVLIPCPKSTEGARERLAGHAARYRPYELAALPDARWIGYADIVAAKVLRRAPFKVRLTLEDGRTHVLARALLAETIGDPTGGLLRPIALLVRSAAHQAD